MTNSLSPTTNSEFHEIDNVDKEVTSITRPEEDEPVTDEAYKQVKRRMKEMIELNDAMNKNYLHAKKKIRTLIFERNLLLDNIGKLENIGHVSDDSDSDACSSLSESEDDLDVSTSNSSKSKILKKLAGKPSSHRRTPTTELPFSLTSSSSSHNNSYMVTQAAPKRSKLNRHSGKTRRVQPIERDGDGSPKLPQQIGVLTVISLGNIITGRPSFHNERYIFPVGYTVSRTYPSMIDPNSNTVITSTIIDGGDAPRFHVTAADQPDEPIIANSATGAWTVVVRKSNEIRHRDHSNSASGPDYYGFKHPTIANLIQDLPGARDLKQYMWQSFEEMEPRAAKGVMAAAEKKRGNLEQMGNANRKVPKGEGDHHDHYLEDMEEDELAASD